MVKQVIAVFWIIGLYLLLEVNAKRPDRYGRSQSIPSGKSYKKHLTKHGFEEDENDSDFSHELVKQHRSSSSHHDEKVHSDEDYLPMKEIISSIVEDDEILSGKKGKKAKGKLKYGADGAIHYFTKNGNHHHAHHHYFYEDSDEAEDGKFDDENDLSSEHKETSKPQMPNRPGSYESYPKEALKSSKKHKFTYDDKLLGSLHKEQYKNKLKPEGSYLKDYSHPNKNKYSFENGHFGDGGFVHITPTPYKTTYKTAHKDFYHGSTKPKIKFEDGHYSEKHKDIMYGFSKQPTFQGVPIKESKKPDIYSHETKDSKKPLQESAIHESDYLSLSKGYPESLSQHKTKYEDSWSVSKPLEQNSDLFKYENDYFPKGSKYTLTPSMHGIDDEQFKEFAKDFKTPTKQKFNLEDALIPTKGLYSSTKSKPVFEENVSSYEFPKSPENSYRHKPSTKPKFTYDTSLLHHTTTKPKVSFESSFMDATIKPVYDPESAPSYKPTSKPKHKFVGLYPELSKPQFDYENYSSRPKYEYENTYSHETTTKSKFEYESSFPHYTTTKSTKPKFDYEHSYPFLPTVKPKHKGRPTTSKPKYTYEAFGSSNFNEEDSILSSKKPSYSTFTKPSSFDDSQDSQKHWQYEQNEEDEDGLQKQKKKKCQRHKSKKGKSHKHVYNVEEEEKFSDEYLTKYPNYSSDYKQDIPKVQEEEYKPPQEEKHIIYYNKEKKRKAGSANKHNDIDSGSLRKYLNLERDQAFNRSFNKESSKSGQKATNFHYTSSSYSPDYDFKNKRGSSRRALYSSYEEQ